MVKQLMRRLAKMARENNRPVALFPQKSLQSDTWRNVAIVIETLLFMTGAVVIAILIKSF